MNVRAHCDGCSEGVAKRIMSLGGVLAALLIVDAKNEIIGILQQPDVLRFISIQPSQVWRINSDAGNKGIPVPGVRLQVRKTTGTV